MEAKTAMKWFLAVLMARSAGLVLWFWGGGMLERDRGGLLAEEGGEVSRCLVIENQLGDGPRVG